MCVCRQLCACVDKYVRTWTGMCLCRQVCACVDSCVRVRASQQVGGGGEREDTIGGATWQRREGVAAFD